MFDVFASQLISYRTFLRNFCIIVSYVYHAIFFENRIFFVRFSYVWFLRKIFVGSSYELFKIRLLNHNSKYNGMTTNTSRLASVTFSQHRQPHECAPDIRHCRLSFIPYKVQASLIRLVDLKDNRSCDKSYTTFQYACEDVVRDLSTVVELFACLKFAVDFPIVAGLSYKLYNILYNVVRCTTNPQRIDVRRGWAKNSRTVVR